MATLKMEYPCLVRVPRRSPVFRFHSLMVLSALPLARVCPSAHMATLQTEFSCPVKVRIQTQEKSTGLTRGSGFLVCFCSTFAAVSVGSGFDASIGSVCEERRSDDMTFTATVRIPSV